MIEDYFFKDGAFAVDGMGLSDILKRHNTPFYLYSRNMMRVKFEKLRQMLPSFDIFYSFKANPNLTICKTMLGLGAGADVSSLGELKAALRAGFEPLNILFVGPGKTEQELRSAIDAGIYGIVAESLHELDLIESIARQVGRPTQVLLRINTLETPDSAEIMVGGPSKFGFDEETVIEDLRGFKPEYVQLMGIHVYCASQVLDSAFISGHIEYVLDLALRLSHRLGLDLRCVDFGGGFGVPYSDDDAELDLMPISAAAQAARRKVASVRPECRLVFEIGRYLIAEAGIFVTRVIRVKRSRGRQFIITDGGMNHMTRPAFLRLNHPVRILTKMGLKNQGEFDIVGPVCTPLDIIANSVGLPTPERGDIIGIFNAGAYGYTMSMINFMSLGWPAEIMIEEGRSRVIRRAREAEDLFGEQVPEDLTQPSRP